MIQQGQKIPELHVATIKSHTSLDVLWGKPLFRKVGGQTATPDGFDRRDAGTLASLVDQWLARLETRAYSPRTVASRVWALRSFLSWGEARGLSRPAEVDKPVLAHFK